MICCISVDGVDGAGKTTLIESLAQRYNIANLPRFYCMGMAPQNSQERKDWFISNDVLFTTKIYISGYKLRLAAAREFKRGLHYKFPINVTNNLVVMDRGIWSLRAYSFAMLIKIGTLSSEEADKKTTELLDREIENLADDAIDLSILLFHDSHECLKNIIARRNCDENERLLISYQHEYYSRHLAEIKDSAKVSIISPIIPPEDIFKIVVDKIEVKRCTETATTC